MFVVFLAGNLQVKSNSVLNSYWRINCIKSDADKYLKDVILVSRAIDNKEGFALANGSTLAGGQRMARVYKQNFTVRVTLQPGAASAMFHSKGLEAV